MATLLYRLGLGSVRHRGMVVVLWLLLLLGAGAGAATLSGQTVNTFEIPGQESTTALDIMAERFGEAATGATAQVVVAAPAGGTVTDDTQKIETLVDKLGRLPGVESASDPFDPRAPTVSADGLAAYSTVTYGVTAPEITESERSALLDAVTAAGTDGLSVEIRGDAAQPTGAAIGGPAEALGVVLALVVLAITYGSLVTAGMNLLTAFVGVGLGALGIMIVSGFTQLQSTTPILAVMLGLAVGIDYTLFIVTRYRHELLTGRPAPEAAALAVGTAGSAVVTAGLTVVIALSGLAVTGIPFLTEMGLAAAATIVVAVLVAVTLVPAILGFLRTRVLPRAARRAVAEGRTPEHRDRGFYRGWATKVTRRPVVTLVLAVVALGVVAAPVLSMRTSLIQNPAAGSTQARANELVSRHFGPGFTGPLIVLVTGSGAGERAAAIRVAADALDDVAVAGAPTISPDGTAALVTVVPASAPESEATDNLVHTLRDDLARDGATEATRVYVTGATAVNIDVSEKLSAALPVYLVLVVGLALLLLILVFRAIMVPVVGVLGFLLTIGAALGAATAVFQWGWLAGVVRADATGPLLSLSPIIIVGILFGLAMDYQVFLVSRMHEAHAHGDEPRAVVVTGFRQAAPVVLAAATIMFSVFAGFVPNGEDTIKPIAFGLAMGILFDAIVVRMIVVPAALTWLGAAAWWLPRWLGWLPELDVEGTRLVRGPTTDSSVH